jgi:YcaO-like protein with predicted kinase domain
MVNDHINSDNYEIFSQKNIIKKFNKFIGYRSELKVLERITVNQYVSRDSCSEDFDAIYQNLSKNINNITLFQDRFNTEVCIDIHLKAFDAEKAIAVSNFIVNYNIDYLNFTFDFPPLDKNSASLIISNLEQFLLDPILRNSKIRLLNFPFCFIIPEGYTCLYRHVIDTLRGEIFHQRDTIHKLKKQRFSYFKPCRACRCKTPCYAYTDIQRFPAYSLFLSPRTQDTAVFIGGSLQENERYLDSDIIYVTPAQQGDMFMTILEGFKNIIIIDGYFYSKFPCTTFEVMLALEEGINVFGSSSIGALRSVELDNYGMTGVGYVYEYLKKQHIKPYHIVAQIYDDNDKSMNVPLVNIIYFLERSLFEGIISKDEFDRCMKISDNIHFSLLSFKYFFKQLNVKKRLSSDAIKKLENFFLLKGEEFFNIKKKDALLLLNTFRGIIKNRSQDYVRIVFNRAKDKYLRILYNKYRCSYDLTLPKNWKLSSAKKKASIFLSMRGNRASPPSETCRWAKIFFKDLDIVIIYTTRYDPADSFIISIIFIPFYFLDYGLSSSTGDGDIFEEALASAYMELIERIPLFGFDIAALAYNRIASKPFAYKNLPQYYNWDVNLRYKSEMIKKYGYVSVTEILSGKDILIPKFVAMSITSSSDGNASGNSLPEAILYGIYELIERDIYRMFVFEILSNLKSKLVIDQREIKDRSCRSLLKQFEEKGCKVVLLNLLNIYNISCVRCYLYDSNLRIEHHGSMAVRSDLYSAIYAALHEAYMGYIIYYAGTRDDFISLLNKNMNIGYNYGQEMFMVNKNFLKIDYQPAIFNSIVEELEYVINKLKVAGIEDIIVVDTSPHDKYNLKSVKVIIPKLELFSLIGNKYRPSPFFYDKLYRTIALMRDLAS